MTTYTYRSYMLYGLSCNFQSTSLENDPALLCVFTKSAWTSKVRTRCSTSSQMAMISIAWSGRFICKNTKTWRQEHEVSRTSGGWLVDVCSLHYKGLASYHRLPIGYLNSLPRTCLGWVLKLLGAICFRVNHRVGEWEKFQLPMDRFNGTNRFFTKRFLRNLLCVIYF